MTYRNDQTRAAARAILNRKRALRRGSGPSRRLWLYVALGFIAFLAVAVPTFGSYYEREYVTTTVNTKERVCGGNGHQHCLMFLCTNEEVQQRWLGRYPNKPAVVVGSPRLDAWHSKDRGEDEPRTVAVTFHWNAQFTGIPETASAFSDYSENLLDAVVRWNQSGYKVLGHNHPRYSAVADFWKSAEMRPYVEYVDNAAAILDRASILVADNTSMQAEFLSLGRRVVWLNARNYRKDVSHGGRFWTWPRTLGGCQVDTPASLALLDLDTVPHATGHPYAFADGNASQRAADAIVTILAGS